MNILMMTNTYKPILGGLEKSVEEFSRELRTRGHRVVIVAPEYEGMEPEEDVWRIPAIQHFNGSDFAVQLPVPGALDEALKDFRPDIVHTHHPFLIGDTALRVAARHNVPLVFTHHTLYEENVHYVPGDREALKRFVIELSTGFANLADQAIAPSESIMRLMRGRGVTTPIQVVPTGVYVRKFARGARRRFRRKLGIPVDAFVVGHLGRLAPEKNLDFLALAMARFLKEAPQAHCLIAGHGPSEARMAELFCSEGVSGRVHMAGVLEGRGLAAAYHAMDVFAFASQSETQGLVLTEAMAAGTPVVAVDAPGVREVVQDEMNGRLLGRAEIEAFAGALRWVMARTEDESRRLAASCRATARAFAMEVSVDKLADLYASCIIEGFVRRPVEESPFAPVGRLIQTQWALITNLTRAAAVMAIKEDPDRQEAKAGLSAVANS